MPISGMYNAKEAAQFLGIKKYLVYYYARNGKLTPFIKSGLYLFSRDQLEKFKATLQRDGE